MSGRAFGRLMLGIAAWLALPGAAIAQGPGGVLAELARHQGPDRMQRLVDGARKEGHLNLYTSLAADDIGVLVSGFEKKFGIKVSVLALELRERAAACVDGGG